MAQCPFKKMGEYNPLRCCREAGHAGACNWVVAGAPHSKEPKERPILFQGAMVRALLAGTKTQTRRAMSPQPTNTGPAGCIEWRQHTFLMPDAEFPSRARDLCPYGQPGDRLWVRESCRGEELASGEDGVRFLADDAFQPIASTPAAAIQWLKLHTYRGHAGSPVGPVVPGIHMPRWASRITLEVTGVRVERLQAIGDDDARAEGIELLDTNGEWRNYLNPIEFCLTPRASYATLWDSINGAGRWDGNPWVWVVEFKRVVP